MSDAIVVQEAQPLTAVEMRAQVNRIQEVMKSVMQRGQHFGTVPGCGDKPTLLKPGAEKLMMTFRLAADPQVQEIPTDDGITFRVICRITNQATGIFLGSGVGECSSKEDKYNWRATVSDKEWAAVTEDRKRIKYTRNGEIKQIRTNPADVANTVLKMAKKRALVDGILTVTGASDIFTQDIEDMPEEVLGGTKTNGTAKEPPKQPQAQSASGPKDPGKPISEGQKKLIFAKSKAKGVKEEDIKTAFKVAHITDITMGQMNDVIAYIENGALPGAPASTDVPADCTKNAESCNYSSFNADEDMKAYCGDKPCLYPAK